MRDRERHRRELEELAASVKARQDRREVEYRGADNPGNPHGPKIGRGSRHGMSVGGLKGRGVEMKLEPRRTPVRKGARSRRLRKNQWVPA